MPTSSEAVLGFLLAIVPGFLAVAAWARAKTWKGPSGDLRTVLQSISVSAVVQVVLSPLTISWLYPHREKLEEFPERVALWLTLAVLVVPIVGGLLAGAVTNRMTLLAGAPPSIWDWLFTARPPHERFVMIEFKDGTRVAGVFASGSLAMTSPEKRGLYLCPEWSMDAAGDPVRELPGTDGLMIEDLSDVRWVRILRSGEEQDGGQQE